MNKRIFVLDDEPDMIKIATDLLEPEGYIVSSSNNPEQAERKLYENPPDLLILDNRMPGKTGIQVCKTLKAEPRTQGIIVIMVSVKAEESDIVMGLEVGADDYVPKPFRRGELLARIKVALRRKDEPAPPEHFKVGPIEIDYGRYSAKANGKEISLTPKEFELLGYFLRREGRILTRSNLSEKVWGMEWTGSTRTIDVHVDQLRKKLGKLGSWITSLKGIGYRFESEEE